MTGKIKRMIDAIFEYKTQGNPALVPNAHAWLIFKGIFPNRFNETSQDDPILIEKLSSIAKELGIKI